MKFWIPLLIVLLFSSQLCADDLVIGQAHLQQAESHVRSGSLFAAVEEYRKAIAAGIEDAAVEQQLSILLYHQGFVDEATAAMERAVEIEPDTDYLHHELGVLYFARDRWSDARRHFLESLRINPVQSDSHYYLAQLFMRSNNLVAARLFARSALELGHPARDVAIRLNLTDYADEKTVWKRDDSRIYLRQMLVDKRPVADQILARIAAGEAFELFARDGIGGGNPHRGGYAGGFLPSELHPDIVSVLTFVKAFSPAQLLELDSGINIIQRVAPLDWNYIDSLIAFDQAADLLTAEKEAIFKAEKVDARQAKVVEPGESPPVIVESGENQKRAAAVEEGKEKSESARSEEALPRKESVATDQVKPREQVAIKPKAKPARKPEKAVKKKTPPESVQQKATAEVKAKSAIIEGEQPTLFFKMPQRPSARPKQFLVQVGAFREKWYALKRIERLKEFGFNGYLREEQRSKTRWYIAIASAYATYGEAHSAVAELKKSGVDAFVLKRR